jgi:type I restriction enzyme, R subunit
VQFFLVPGILIDASRFSATLDSILSTPHVVPRNEHIFCLDPSGHDVEHFRDKTQQFLKAHEKDPVIQKLRFNERLTKDDLDALEQMLIKAGAGTPDDLSKVRSGSGLGLFVRSMVGLDREAAKRAFDGFLAGKTLTANQIHFVNLIIDCLTQAGWMSAAQLYESPFTDFSPWGVDGVFDPEHVTQLLSVLENIRLTAEL